MTFVKKILESRIWMWIRRLYLTYSIISDILIFIGLIALASGSISIIF